ncbi:hypothetical protein HPB48_008745 [Haemaphysalis longicornis]|uniref:Uncharacterized protein n=1 Tax=Haemaphysalis longicornis TaxID=44386 RepID=A0A9J6G675_HAELO|nr:hypothetical protein HPB48_008745 [Haemaphysalis longicornis]
MSTLSLFPPPPAKQLVTLYEKDGDLHAGTESDWKELSEREKGFVGFLEQLSKYNEPSVGHGLLGRRDQHGRALPFASFSDLYNQCQFMGSFGGKSCVGRISERRKKRLCQHNATSCPRSKGHVRAFAWHPQCPKFAVASHGDMVRVYAPDTSIMPMLKHKSQRNITDMAWKPSAAYASLLAREGHGPVTSIAWHPKGSLLASASAADCSLLASAPLSCFRRLSQIWNVSMEECVPLTRLAGGGVSLLRWSPQGSRLFAASPKSVLRVWDTKAWQFDRWSSQQGRCQAACWSPDGRWLLCSFAERPALYALGFPPSPAVSEDDELNEASELGPPPGHHLWHRPARGRPQRGRPATTLRHWAQRQVDHGEYVALFRTRTSPVFEVFPCGFVTGPPVLEQWCGEPRAAVLLPHLAQRDICEEHQPAGHPARLTTPVQLLGGRGKRNRGMCM